MPSLQATSLQLRACFFVPLLFVSVADAQEPKDVILSRLKKECETQPTLRGIRIADGRAEGDKLMLLGDVDNKAQVPLLLAEATKVLKSVPTVQKAFAEGVAEGEFTVVPIRSEYLQSLQRDFAEGLVEGKDTQTQLLKQTRLDDVYYSAADGHMRFSGVCINSIAFEAAKDPRQEAGLSNSLAIVLQRQLELYMPEHEHRVETQMRFLEPLEPLLQNATTAVPELDGVVFARTSYDADGVLHLHGVLGHPDQAAALTNLIRERIPNERYLESTEKSFSIERMQPTQFRSQFVSGMQLELARDDNRILRRTRLDRAYFQYSESGLQLDVVGLCIDADFEDAKDALLRSVKRKAEGAITAIPKDAYRANVGEVRVIQDPRPIIQRSIAADGRLDGSLIEDSAFDSEGNLELSGMLGDASQRETLRSLVERQLTGTLGDSSALRSFTLDRMRETRFRETFIPTVQTSLATESEQLFRRTRVDRAYFTYSPLGSVELRLQGVNFHHGETSANLEIFLRRAANNLFATLRAPDHKLVVEEVRKLDFPPYVLQRLLPSHPALDHVLFEDAAYDQEGDLQIKGTIQRAEQAATLGDLVRERFGATKFLRPSASSESPAWSLQLEIYDLQGAVAQLTDRIRKEFADEPATLFGRTRLDGARFTPTESGSLQLQFEGMSLTNDTSTNARNELANRLESEAHALLSRPRPESYTATADRIVVRPDFTLRLQEILMEMPKFDGVSLRSVAFESTGAPYFRGFTESEQQKNDLAQLLQERLISSGILRSTADLDTLVARLRVYPINSYRRQIQREFYESGDLLRQQTQLTRCFFDSSGKVRFGGLVFSQTRPDPERLARVAAFIEKAMQTLDPHFAEIPGIDMSEMDVIANPASAIQDRVARLRSLDGVRVDAAFFDSASQLAFVGIWNGPKQADTLRRVIDEITPAGLLRPGVSLAPMKTVSTERLLEQLRSWTAKTLNEVRVDRLYFSKDGRLSLSGICADEASRVQLQKALQGFIEAGPLHEHMKPLKLPSADRETSSGLPMPSVAINANLKRSAQRFVFVRLQPADEPSEPIVQLEIGESLLQHLRVLVAEDEMLNGVLIERGFYNPDGRFTISGLIDSDEQMSLLTERVARIGAQPRWAKQLAFGWQVGTLQSVPLEPMIACLCRVLPAFPVFDGVAISGARHDATNALAFQGSAPPDVDRDEMTRVLTHLLNGHSSWRRRAQSGITLAEIISESATRESSVSHLTGEAMNLLYHGSYNDAIEILNSVILNEPNDTVGWELRALAMLSRGDEWAARRDLRRLVMLEEATGPLYKYRRRYQLLSRFQGEVRTRFERMRLQTLTQVKCGFDPPESLADACAQPSTPLRDFYGSQSPLSGCFGCAN